MVVGADHCGHVSVCIVYNYIVVFIIFCHTASVARHIYLRPGAGVGAMQKIHGGELYVLW